MTTGQELNNGMSQVVQHTSEPCYHTECTGRWKTQMMKGDNNGGDRIIDDSDRLTGGMGTTDDRSRDLGKICWQRR
jgi:hypothetical protein